MSSERPLSDPGRPRDTSKELRLSGTTVGWRSSKTFNLRMHPMIFNRLLSAAFPGGRGWKPRWDGSRGQCYNNSHLWKLKLMQRTIYKTEVAITGEVQLSQLTRHTQAKRPGRKDQEAKVHSRTTRLHLYDDANWDSGSQLSNGPTKTFLVLPGLHPRLAPSTRKGTRPPPST